MQLQPKGFQAHRLIVGQKLLTNAEKLRFSRDTANSVKELAGRFDTHPQVIEILFHLLNLRRFSNLWRAYRFVKRPDIVKNVSSAGESHGFALLVPPNLFEEPGIPNSPTTDH